MQSALSARGEFRQRFARRLLKVQWSTSFCRSVLLHPCAGHAESSSECLRLRKR